MARAVGEPLHVDEATSKETRPRVARVCVEADLRQEHPDEIWMDAPDGLSFAQKITYEYLPEYCRLCSQIGHATGECKGKKQANDQRREWVMKKGVEGLERQKEDGVPVDKSEEARGPIEVQREDEVLKVASMGKSDAQAEITSEAVFSSPLALHAALMQQSHQFVATDAMRVSTSSNPSKATLLPTDLPPVDDVNQVQDPELPSDIDAAPVLERTGEEVSSLAVVLHIPNDVEQLVETGGRACSADANDGGTGHLSESDSVQGDAAKGGLFQGTSSGDSEFVEVQSKTTKRRAKKDALPVVSTICTRQSSKAASLKSFASVSQ